MNLSPLFLLFILEPTGQREMLESPAKPCQKKSSSCAITNMLLKVLVNVVIWPEMLFILHSNMIESSDRREYSCIAIVKVLEVDWQKTNTSILSKGSGSKKHNSITKSFESWIYRSQIPRSSITFRMSRWTIKRWITQPSPFSLWDRRWWSSAPFASSLGQFSVFYASCVTGKSLTCERITII